MKGLRKYIAPFAPDQSGAAAVFCELGGLVIILDAGGCAGNICGFDEPRWFDSKSAIFSAGLRDMDAILGRDDKLVEKIEKACAKIEGAFVAVIGTPVPAVIGTDYTALRHMIEKKTGLPTVTVNTNGMELYDAGVEKAYLELFRTFSEKEAISKGRIASDGKAERNAEQNVERNVGQNAERNVDQNVEQNGEQYKEIGKKGGKKIPGSLGILGATPMDVVEPNHSGTCTQIEAYYRNEGWQEVCCYGMGAGLSAVRKAGQVEKNIVIAPAGLQAAKYLEKRWGTPYEAAYPLAAIPDGERLLQQVCSGQDQKILIVHQQVLGHSLRKEIRSRCDASVTVASWFAMEKELREPGDVSLKEEDQWIALVKEGQYDWIIGDELFLRAVPRWKGKYLSLPHFAVSGKK
ncbi:MAG: nitrogenase molybdenum-iron protein [Clostridiales bacterium]|nr:nitrogenase molybdenum-iron protein [Clostridiales bacterium]